MEIFKHLIVALLDIAALTVLVHAQSQSDLGFISIDCGLLQTSGYTDEKTGIDYTSDANFTETGASFNISSEYNLDTLEQPFRTVRSFPTGIKNCYTVNLTRPNVKFLIRASFMYGNYDGKSKPPRFDLLLEADVWDTIEFINSSTVVTKEILHLPQRNYVHVCLVNTYSGTPFISSLELRPLNNLTYTTQSGSLLLHLRLDVGSNSRIPIRYKDDIYDRIWTPYTRSDWKEINTSLSVNPDSEYQQPSAVMRTAVIPADGSDCLTYSVAASACPDNAAQYHVYMHFAELQAQEQVNNQPRQLYIYGSGKLWYNIPYVPNYLASGILYSSANGSNLDFSIHKTQNSPLPPILNAIEVYREQELSQPLTDQQDVTAIMSIKTWYGVKRSNWQGDPCSPKVHVWQGLQCFYDDYNPPRIIFLDLSSSGISGAIAPSISSLTKLQYLNLSYNSLSGPVPNFLSQMAFLVVLNLTGNKLEGVVPAELKERMDAGLLTLSVEGNRGLSLSRKKKKEPLLIVATVVPTVNLVGTLATLWILKTRNKAAAAKAVKNLASEADLGDDDENLDGSREDGTNNTMTNDEKDESRVSSKSKTRQFRGSKNNDRMKENKRVNTFHSGSGEPTINDPTMNGEKDMNRAYSKTKRDDEICDNEDEAENICAEEYSREDNINLDGSREDGPDNTMPPEEKDKSRVSSKLKTRHFKGSNNNDRMNENKSVDTFHSEINDSTINEEKDMNRAYSKTKRDDEICDDEDEEENICAEEYSREDNVNLDGSREDDPDNTMPPEEKDKSRVSSKLKTRHFRGSKNNERIKENKSVDTFRSEINDSIINKEKDMNRAYSKMRDDKICDNEDEEENICAEEYSGEDNINLDGSKEDGPDNTTPPEGVIVGSEQPKVPEEAVSQGYSKEDDVNLDESIEDGLDNTTTTEDLPLPASKEYSEEDNVNPDGLREEGPGNTRTTRGKNIGRAFSKSKKSLSKVSDNSDRSKENKYAEPFHSMYGDVGSSSLGDLGDPGVREGNLDDLTNIEGEGDLDDSNIVEDLPLLASKEYSEEDNVLDGLREDGPNNPRNTRGKDTGGASSKLKKRPSKVSDNNDRMKENKRADPFHSMFGEARSSLLGDLGDPGVREGNLDDLTNIEGEGDPEDSNIVKALPLLASKEYLEKDNVNLDGLRKDGPDNTKTIGGKDTGHASSKPKKRPSKVSDNNDWMKENKCVDPFQSMSGEAGSSFLGDLDDLGVRAGDIDDLTNIEGEGDPDDSTIVKDLDRAASNPKRMLAEGYNLMGANIPAEVPYFGSNKPPSSSFGVNPGDGSPSHKGPNLPSGRGKQVRGKAPSSSKGNSANPIGALFDDATKCVSSDAAAQLVDSSPLESLEKEALSAYMSAASAVPDPSHALETITEGEYRSPSDLHSHPKIHAMSNQMANPERGLKAKQKEIGPLKAPRAHLEAEVDKSSNKLYKMSQQGILPNQPYIDQSNFMPSPFDKNDPDNLKNKNEAASSTGDLLVEKDGDFDFPKVDTQEGEEVEVPTVDQDTIPSEGADPPTNA